MNFDIKRNMKVNNSSLKKKKNLDDFFEQKEQEKIEFSFLGIADGMSKNWEKEYTNRLSK
jgi:hypothetical protein